ncbi:MAG: TraB/GumN family protein [Telluria sp.]
MAGIVLRAVRWVPALVALLASVPVHAGDVASAASAHFSTQANAMAGPAPVTAHHQGGLYRISRNGRVAYLFGTVHVGARSFYPLAPEVRRALASASRIVVELDTSGNDDFLRAVRHHGSYPPGDDVRRHLAPDTLAQLTEALHENGETVSAMARFKPWLLANLLLSWNLQRAGYTRGDGVESVLLAKARRRGAPVAELESADYQLGLYDTMNEVESERYLRATLRALRDGSALRRSQAVIDAWISGDPASLEALLPDATRRDDPVADFNRRVLLGRRNVDMAEHIGQLMDGSSVTFVGVGLLHLLGANGLPQLLAQRGYLVEQVY